MGRKKLEMKMVENSNSRQVIFSKRRNGVFIKASELVSLCGAEVAILVFSPGNKPFSYGHPSVDAVFDKILKNDPAISDDRLASECNKKIEKLNQKLADLQNELELERRKGELLDRKIEKMEEMEACSALLLLSYPRA